MFESADAYWSIFVVNFKDSLSDRSDLVVQCIFSLIVSLILIIVWTAVYSASSLTEIMGVSLTTLYVYFLFVSAFRTIFDTSLPQIISDDISTGNIAVTMTRPIRYIDQVLLRGLGASAADALFIAAPLIVVGLLFLHVGISATTFVYFLAELAVGYAITSSIEFMLGCTAVYTTEIWGVVVVNWQLIYLLGGGIVPLLFLPSWAGAIANALPFKYLLYVPAATLLGIGTMNLLQTLAIGVLWSIVLACGAAFMWSKVKKSVSAVGG